MTPAASLFPSMGQWLSVTGLVLPLLLATLVCGALALVGWRHRHKPGGPELTLLMSGAALWAFFYALELASAGLAAKTLWAQLQYLGITVLPVAWFFFARAYTGETKPAHPRLLLPMCLMPVLTFVLVVTNARHHLVWSSAALDASGTSLGLAVTHGPWFWAHIAYSYGLLAAGSYVLISAVRRYPIRYRQQAGLLLLATALPWVGNALFILGVRPTGNVDLTPLAFALTGLLLLADMTRLGFFSLLPALLPTARNQLLEKMRDGVLVADRDGAIVMANPAAVAMLGAPEDRITSTNVSVLLGLPTDLAENAGDGGIPDGHAEIALGDAWGTRTYDVVWSPLNLRGRTGMGRLLVLRDISERIRAEEVLRESEYRYRSLFDHAHDLVFSLDGDGRFTSMNEATLKASGYTREELCQLKLGDVVSPSERRRLEGLFRSKSLHADSAMLEMEFLAREGGRVLVEASVHQLRDRGARVGFQCVCHDVTERGLWEEALRHQALHDGTTGLPNRSFFRERLHQVVTAPTLRDQAYALLVLDLDGFKDINDTFGHHCGDALLRQVGYRLQKAMRTADVVARLGGDEFALLVQEDDAAHGSRAALRVLDALLPVYEVEGQSLRLSASVGVAMYPEDGKDAETLLRYADIAMYMAKRAGGGRYALYRADRDRRNSAGVALQCELRAALERDELTLYYQPQIDCRDGSIATVEALARWEHPLRGLIMPAEFISLAERDGMIGHLTAWALSSALAQCALWREEGKQACVAVNLSTRDLDNPDFPTSLSRIIHSCSADPSWLTVEVTESSIVIDPERTGASLRDLRGLGIRIAVDDFGAGHTSLTHLKRLPLDILKIDKSFVMNMTVDRSDAAIVRSTIGLAHDLGLLTVAEGVENVATLQLLKALGCDIAQGNFLGRPMPAEAAGAAAPRDRSLPLAPRAFAG